MGWFTEGPKNAPAADALLALSNGSPFEIEQDMYIIIAASLACRVRFERLDAGSVVTYSQIIACPALDTKTIEMPSFKLLTDERVRIVNQAAIIGLAIQASLSVPTIAN